MKRALAISASALAILLVSSAGYAEKRPHEGKIVRIETVEKSMVIQGEKGDEWTLYWDATTKFKHGLAPSELREGDSVHFDFVQKDGKMWVTELRRTKKADRD
jgi:Cu/Ag efflux protein CusF